MGFSSRQRQLSHGSYAVALICPHELVLSAVRFMLDEEHKSLPKEKNDPLYYVLGSMSGHNVVVASLPGGVPGDVSTATIATHLIHTFPAAELRLMVNISGGVPNTSEDIQLGDVVVSDPDPQRSGVVTYDFGKVTNHGFERRVRYMPPTPAPLVGACVSMRHDHRSNPRPIPDILSAISKKHCGMKAFSRPTSQNELPPQSNVHYGIIASGARVVRDSKQRDELAAEFGAICLDTAASGLECYAGLVVCGIYHNCDSDYNNAWAGYAAAAAAACARNMLSFIPPVDSQFATRKADSLKKLGSSAYQDRKDSHASPIEGTCQWLTTHPYFQEWHEGEGPGLLWVSSDPWTGKSVWVKHLIDEVIRSSPNIVVCYHFFIMSCDDSHLSRVFAGILRQLFSQQPQLLSESALKVLDSYHESHFLPSSDFFETLTGAAREYGDEIILVLDGLNLAPTYERGSLVNALADFFDNPTIPNLRVLFTSRASVSTQEILQALENKHPSIHIRGEDEAHVQRISEDVDIYIRHRVTEIATQRCLLDDEKNLLLLRLTSTVNRTYLWAKHVLDEINQVEAVTRKSIHGITNHLPDTVKQEYAEITQWCISYGASKAIFQIVAEAKRPLSLDELATALTCVDDVEIQIEPTHRFRQTVRSMCGLLVTVLNGKVEFIHPSVRDFVVQRTKNPYAWSPGWGQSLWPGDSHQVLAEACVGYLYRIYCTGTRPLSSRDDDLDLAPTVLPDDVFLEYAVTNWHHHMGLADLDEENDATIHEHVLDLLQHEDDVNKVTPFWSRGGMIADTCSGGGPTPLMKAAFFGLSHATQTLLQDLKRADLYALTCSGRSALSFAAESGHEEIMYLLLNSMYQRRCVFTRRFKKLRVDVPDVSGRTPFWYAANGGHEGAAKLLLEAGKVDLDRPDKYELATPLACAAGNGHRGVVRVLLDSGKVDLETRDALGDTPLMRAMRSGHKDVVRLLVAAGAKSPEPAAKDDSAFCAGKEKKTRHPDEKLAILDPDSDDDELTVFGDDRDTFAVRLPLDRLATADAMDEENCRRRF